MSQPEFSKIAPRLQQYNGSKMGVTEFRDVFPDVSYDQGSSYRLANATPFMISTKRIVGIYKTGAPGSESIVVLALAQY